MIDRTHRLSIVRQAKALGISRGSLCYLSAGEHRPRRWTRSFDCLRKAMLRRPVESAQFTSIGFIEVLLAAGIAISMDGKGAWRDNIFVGRLWRTVKYEEVYLRAYASVSEARVSIGRYLRLLQRPAPAFIAWRADARTGILHPPQPIPAAAKTGRTSTQAAALDLFRQAEPPPSPRGPAGA